MLCMRTCVRGWVGGGGGGGGGVCVCVCVLWWWWCVCVCAFVCERDDVPVYTCTGLHVGMLV